MQLKQRIKKAEKGLLPPVVISELSDSAIEKICADHYTNRPNQAAAVDAVIVSLTDEELIMIRDGRSCLLSLETRRRLHNAYQTKD